MVRPLSVEDDDADDADDVSLLYSSMIELPAFVLPNLLSISTARRLGAILLMAPLRALAHCIQQASEDKRTDVFKFLPYFRFCFSLFWRYSREMDNYRTIK
jgi:hypothetical protein